jgi:hypothetical protein
MSKSKSLEKLQVITSLYDYVAAGVFAFPILSAWYISTMMYGTHELMGSHGSYPAFDPFHLLFANLFGGFAIMWSTLRIVKRLPVMGMCDGYLRLYYACIMSIYFFVFGTTAILLAFIAIELIFGSWQLYLYYGSQKEEPFEIPSRTTQSLA